MIIIHKKIKDMLLPNNISPSDNIYVKITANQLDEIMNHQHTIGDIIGTEDLSDTIELKNQINELQSKINVLQITVDKLNNKIESQSISTMDDMSFDEIK